VNNLANFPIDSSIQVFLVDDYPPVLWGLSKLIQGEYPRMRLVGTANTRNATITGVIQHQPDVILLDYELSNQSSLDFLSQLPYSVITAFSSSSANNTRVSSHAKP
jgi:DNA-binding NarL/FixJ family response regulator